MCMPHISSSFRILANIFVWVAFWRVPGAILLRCLSWWLLVVLLLYKFHKLLFGNHRVSMHGGVDFCRLWSCRSYHSSSSSLIAAHFSKVSLAMQGIHRVLALQAWLNHAQRTFPVRPAINTLLGNNKKKLTSCDGNIIFYCIDYLFDCFISWHSSCNDIFFNGRCPRWP